MEQEKLDKALQRLKSFEPEEGYFLAFSGGKDSQCVYHLAQMADVKFDAHYSVTSVDPPELIHFIRKKYPDIIFDYPRDKDGKRITMWNLIPVNGMPPTRLARYCCRILKESSGKGRITITGVRWAESARRAAIHDVAEIFGKPKTTRSLADEMNVSYDTNNDKKLVLNDDNDENRRIVEHCYRTQKTMVNPIIDWSDDDVWDFLNNIAKVEHCCLYDQGYERIGCIGCPMANKQRTKHFERYPQYKNNYLKAFERMLALNEVNGKISKNDWKTPEDVMNWWIGS